MAALENGFATKKHKRQDKNESQSEWIIILRTLSANQTYSWDLLSSGKPFSAAESSGEYRVYKVQGSLCNNNLQQ